MNTFVTFKIEDAMKTFRYILFVWVMLGCGLFASCEDDEVEYAPLAVTRVSTVLDREQGIDQANLAQYIIVQGTGLNAVNSILDTLRYEPGYQGCGTGLRCSAIISHTTS